VGGPAESTAVSYGKAMQRSEIGWNVQEGTASRFLRLASERHRVRFDSEGFSRFPKL